MEWLFKVVPAEYCVTIGLCFLASLCVAIIMRFFVKTALTKVEEYMTGKFHEGDKALAIYKTVKSYALLCIACVITLVFLKKLFAVATFPCENNKALLFFYFVPMFALQFFLDTHMKKLACKAFGLPFEEEPKEEKVVKPRIYKIDGEKLSKTKLAN